MTIPLDAALALRGLIIACRALSNLVGATLGRCEGTDAHRSATYRWRRRRCTATGVRVVVRSSHAVPGGGVRCVCPRHGYKPGVTPIVPADRP